MANPTPRQRRFLEKIKLVVPPTKRSCSRLIGFILDGNYTVGNDKGERIAIARSLFERWLGKRVYYRCGERFGRVRYLLFRTAEEVRVLRHWDRRNDNLCPATMYIDWEEKGSRSSFLTVSLLEIVEDQSANENQLENTAR